MNPDPNPKMRFASVKQLLYPFVGVLRHTPKMGMAEPVLSSIFGKRKLLEAVSCDIFVEVQ
jgi:hypothetical protein